MKITLIREERESGKEAVSTQETDMLMEKLKTENKTGYITELRSIIPHLKGTNARYEHIDRLPRLYPAVEMTRAKAGERRIKTYNGLVQLEVNNLAGVAEAELVKQQAALLPQTFAAFCGSSGRSAKIWVRFTLPDGGLPKNEDDIALFHAHAYRLAVKCYQPLLPFPITLQAPSLLQSCRMTVDEQPYYSPTAVAFCLEQPCALPSEDNYRQRKQQESNPLLRMTPGYEVADTCNLLFEAALDRAFRDLDNWRRGDDLRPLLSRLAEHCFKAGIPEEEVVRQTLMHYYREADEPLVRLTLHNLYGELKGFGTRSSLNKDRKREYVCGTATSPASCLRTTCRYTTPSKNISITPDAGTAKTASAHWPTSCPAIIPTGGNCSTGGFLAWWHIGGESTNSTATIPRPCS